MIMEKFAEIYNRIGKAAIIPVIKLNRVEEAVPLAQALLAGGIPVAEVTFRTDAAAEGIAAIRREVPQMLVGAGTVMSPEEVMLAYNAGASYIISPNCDPEVIGLTRKLGLVSIPAAFTATEIGAAIKHGADYIKLFPADGVGDGYVKAVKAPLADAKLLAVGGVSAENAGEWLKKGFCGVGVGSNLYNNKLIEAGDFAALTELAKKFVKAIGQRFSPDGQ